MSYLDIISAEIVKEPGLGKREIRILAALRNAPDGLSRTRISSLFCRNLSSQRIDQALAILLKLNLIRVEQVRTAGRSIEIWRAN
jgi:hypothetical protein